jgi:hypothetical protein
MGGRHVRAENRITATATPATSQSSLSTPKIPALPRTNCQPATDPSATPIRSSRDGGDDVLGVRAEGGANADLAGTL